MRPPLLTHWGSRRTVGRDVVRESLHERVVGRRAVVRRRSARQSERLIVARDSIDDVGQPIMANGHRRGGVEPSRALCHRLRGNDVATRATGDQNGDEERGIDEAILMHVHFLSYVRLEIKPRRSR
jgi:hypothetical protein